MKKIMWALLLVVLTWGTAMADFIKHPQYAKISTFTASVIDTIAAKQAEYFTVKGKYFQGVWLLGDVQADGTTDTSVINTVKLIDQDETWYEFAPDIFKKQLKIPVNIKIDVYESPDGWGWIFTAEVWIDGYGPDAYGNDGNHWVYRHNEGPYDFNEIEDEWYIFPEF